VAAERTFSGGIEIHIFRRQNQEWRFGEVREARVKVTVANDVLRVRVRVVTDGADVDESYELPTRRREGVVSVTKRVVERLRCGCGKSER